MRFAAFILLSTALAASAQTPAAPEATSARNMPRAAAGQPASAQDTLQLTLHESEQIAIRNNPRVSAARFGAEAYNEIPKELRSNYQPTVFGSITGAGAGTDSRV